MRRRWLIAVTFFLAGGICGAFLFSRTLPRSFLAANECGQCLPASDLAGLIASVGIQNAGGLIPVVKETDECFAIRHPHAPERVHLVLVPKRDIRNIGELGPDDERYLMGCLALAGDLIRSEHLDHYRLLTNGPGVQAVTYLHLHLVAQ